MISIVVMEPETSGNIGSIARVMANFEFEDLVLISPKCRVDEDSRRFAKNAQEVLKGARIGTIDALKGFDFLVGTTSRIGRDYNILRTPMMPDEFAKKVSEIKGKRVALILGREGDGLSNEEIMMCDFIVTIPTSKGYDSMNVSHALAILLYEVRKQEFSGEIMKKYAPMGAREKEQALKLVEESIQKMDFVTDEKRETQRRLWRRMISKAMLTRREAFALMGYLKKVLKRR